MKNKFEEQSLIGDIGDIYALLASESPSKNMLESWIAHCVDLNYPKHTQNGGKWLIECTKQEVDAVWEQIKDALDAGRLGDMAKVSTAKQGSKHKTHVICVYTYDSNDTKDMLKIREVLRGMGFDKPLHYKRDIETINGVYGIPGEFYLTL